MCVGDVVSGTPFSREEETGVKFRYQIMVWHSFIKIVLKMISFGINIYWKLIYYQIIDFKELEWINLNASTTNRKQHIIQFFIKSNINFQFQSESDMCIHCSHILLTKPAESIQ